MVGRKTRGFDFSDADKIDANAFNHILWQGSMGDNVPYPAFRSHQDLRQNRAQLIKRWKEESKVRSAQTTLSSTGVSKSIKCQQWVVCSVLARA